VAEVNDALQRDPLADTKFDLLHALVRPFKKGVKDSILPVCFGIGYRGSG